MMLELTSKLTLDQATIESKNLCDQFSDEDLDTLGRWVYDGYQQDWNSCAKWRERTSAGLDLAMQITRNKTFPWPDCANVAFPLVTIGVLQYHSRAYPALINGPEVVKCRTIGKDADGVKKGRAHRISTHMSWQVLEEDEGWEPEHDKLFVNQACVGMAYVKSRRSDGINVSELVLAKDLVVNYWTKSLDKCPRKTHIIPLYRNDIYTRVKRGEFKDVLDETWYASPVAPKDNRTEEDKRHGVKPPATPDETTPFIGLEQHVSADLDQDGYAEPYIITIEENSQKVLRIVARFERPEDIQRNDKGEIVSVAAREYFTKYGFIPAPDGSFMDIGFGVLLGPLNETVNSTIDILLDAGVLNTTAGGFLGRGAKIRGGVFTFRPFEWPRLDASGDDIRKSVFPFPKNEPSEVLFKLLGLIIQYADRIPGATELNVGENVGQNTPAETSRIMSDEGRKIYSAIFKRTWRSMKDEFKKLYILNGIYLPVGRSVEYGESGEEISRSDYLEDPRHVVPAADPHVTSQAQGLSKAIAVKQAAMGTPGYKLDEVERYFLRALGVDNIDQLYPGPDKVPPLTNPKVQIEQLKLESKKLQIQTDNQQFMLELQEEKKLNNAKIIELMAKAEAAIADIGATKAGHQIAAFEAAIGALKLHNETLSKRIELLMKGMEIDNAQQSGSKQGGVGGVAGARGNGSTPPSPAGEAAGISGAVI
jgi:chaperonin GroES